MNEKNTGSLEDIIFEQANSIMKLQTDAFNAGYKSGYETAKNELKNLGKPEEVEEEMKSND